MSKKGITQYIREVRRNNAFNTINESDYKNRLRPRSPIDEHHLNFIDKEYDGLLTIDLNPMYPGRDLKSYETTKYEYLCNWRILIDYNEFNPLTRPPVGEAPKLVDKFSLLNKVFYSGRRSHRIRDPGSVLDGETFYIWGKKRWYTSVLDKSFPDQIITKLDECATDVELILNDVADRKGLSEPYFNELKPIIRKF